MDRLEYIRMHVDQIIDTIQDPMIRRLAYIHTYGVSNNAALLAKFRHVDSELACIAAMLHDISIYQENYPHNKHAKRSSELAKELLVSSNLFSETEISHITMAISCHSDKLCRDDDPLSELLKDADVLERYLYNQKIERSPKENFRLYHLFEDIENK